MDISRNVFPVAGPLWTRGFFKVTAQQDIGFYTFLRISTNTLVFSQRVEKLDFHLIYAHTAKDSYHSSAYIVNFIGKVICLTFQMAKTSFCWMGQVRKLIHK